MFAGRKLDENWAVSNFLDSLLHRLSSSGTKKKKERKISAYFYLFIQRFSLLKDALVDYHKVKDYTWSNLLRKPIIIHKHFLHKYEYIH